MGAINLDAISPADFARTFRAELDIIRRIYAGMLAVRNGDHERSWLDLQRLLLQGSSVYWGPGGRPEKDPGWWGRNKIFRHGIDRLEAWLPGTEWAPILRAVHVLAKPFGTGGERVHGDFAKVANHWISWVASGPMPLAVTAAWCGLPLEEKPDGPSASQ